MIADQFDDRLETLISDYEGGKIDARGFRGGIRTLMLDVCLPQLEFEPVKVIPGFSTITTTTKLAEVLEAIDDVDDLNELREVVLGYNKRGDTHPLREPKYNFAFVFRSLDKRADELGFTKFSFGYRDRAADRPKKHK